MMDISKITYNGKEYTIKDQEAQKAINQLLNRLEKLEKITEGVIELDDFSEGTIFIGLMDKTDENTPITYEYLTNQLQKDNTNNKVFANTNQAITVRTNWEWDGILKTPFILVPYSHSNLYMLSTPCQHFTGWKDDYEVVNITFPTGTQRYKFFRFGNWLNQIDLPITYTF